MDLSGKPWTSEWLRCLVLDKLESLSANDFSEGIPEFSP